MTAWRSSRFFPETRTASPWIDPCTFSLLSLISFTSDFAFSISMPWTKLSTWETIFPLCSTGPYFRPRRGTPRFAIFSTSTVRAASSRCSVLLRIFSPFSGALTFSRPVSVPLKSYRWSISFFACWKALSTSCSFTLLTMSKLGMSHLQDDGEDHRALLHALLPRGAYRAPQRLFHQPVLRALRGAQLGERLQRGLPRLRPPRHVEPGHALAEELRAAHHFTALVVEDAQAHQHARLGEELAVAQR